MRNGSPRYPVDPTWRIVRAITAFFRALRVPATTKGWMMAPTTVWNFDHDQLAPAQFILFTEEQKKKHSF